MKAAALLLCSWNCCGPASSPTTPAGSAAETGGLIEANRGAVGVGEWHGVRCDDLCRPTDSSLLWGVMQLQYDHFVGTLLQPVAGHKERSHRPAVPEAAEVLAVDPDS